MAVSGGLCLVSLHAVSNIQEACLRHFVDNAIGIVDKIRLAAAVRREQRREVGRPPAKLDIRAGWTIPVLGPEPNCQFAASEGSMWPRTSADAGQTQS